LYLEEREGGGRVRLGRECEEKETWWQARTAGGGRAEEKGRKRERKM